MKLKKGDKVILIAGKDRGKTGAIVRAFRKENLVLVEGVNLQTKHQKAGSGRSKGQIVQRSMPVHASNVQLVDPKSGKPTRIRITRSKDGARERVATASGEGIK